MTPEHAAEVAAATKVLQGSNPADHVTLTHTDQHGRTVIVDADSHGAMKCIISPGFTKELSEAKSREELRAVFRKHHPELNDGEVDWSVNEHLRVRREQGPVGR